MQEVDAILLQADIVGQTKGVERPLDATLPTAMVKARPMVNTCSEHCISMIRGFKNPRGFIRTMGTKASKGDPETCYI